MKTNEAMYMAVDTAACWVAYAAVDRVVDRTVLNAVYWTLNKPVDDAMSDALFQAMAVAENEALHSDSARIDFLPAGETAP